MLHQTNMEQNLHDDTCLAPSHLVLKQGKTEWISFPNDAEIQDLICFPGNGGRNACTIEN
jgi:hypothetical protein